MNNTLCMAEEKRLMNLVYDRPRMLAWEIGKRILAPSPWFTTMYGINSQHQV